MLKRITLKLIRFYQKPLNPIHLLFKHLSLEIGVCRFTPTCSEYTAQAISKYGIIKGSWKGARRILRCHPWSKGGEDALK